MLEDRVSDLPVVDAAGKLVGMFKLDRLLAVLLPKAALLDYGMPDLTFVSDTLDQLRERMREIEARSVREFVVKPDHVVHPAHLAARNRAAALQGRRQRGSRRRARHRAARRPWSRRATC